MTVIIKCLAIQRFSLHHCDHCCALTEPYNNCAETHLSGGVMSTFILSLAFIAQALTLAVQEKPTWVGSYKQIPPAPMGMISTRKLETASLCCHSKANTVHMCHDTIFDGPRPKPTLARITFIHTLDERSGNETNKKHTDHHH